MELINRIVFVKDPEVLPTNVTHADAIDSLSRTNNVVILLSHGNKYILPSDWITPHNVTFLEYELEMSSIQECVIKLREVLHSHGIEVYSRHLPDRFDVLPLPLSGALLVNNIGTELSFINNEQQFKLDKPKSDSYDFDLSWDF